MLISDLGSDDNGGQRRYQGIIEAHITQGEIIRKPIPPPFRPEDDPLSRPRHQDYSTEVWSNFQTKAV